MVRFVARPKRGKTEKVKEDRGRVFISVKILFSTFNYTMYYANARSQYGSPKIARTLSERARAQMNRKFRFQL